MRRVAKIVLSLACLLLAASLAWWPYEAGAADLYSCTATGGTFKLGETNTSVSVAMPFSFAEAATITTVSFWGVRESNPTGNVRVRLVADNGNVPDLTTVYGTSASVDVSGWSPAAQRDFTFSPGIEYPGGSVTWWAVAEKDWACDGTNYVKLTQDTTGTTCTGIGMRGDVATCESGFQDATGWTSTARDLRLLVSGTLASGGGQIF